MIAAGARRSLLVPLLNAWALSSFMGHSSIKVTFDSYGHLMLGTEAEAAALLDDYLSLACKSGEEAARAAMSAS